MIFEEWFKQESERFSKNTYAIADAMMEERNR